MTFSASDMTLDFSFLVLQEGIFEEAETVSLFLEPAEGETAVQVPDTAQVFILDSDGTD